MMERSCAMRIIVTGRAYLAAAAETFKRVTLELGGEGPQILLEDADLTTAIPIAVASGFVNSGQACIAGTRLLVPESRQGEALGRLKNHVETLKVGAATDPEAQIGPMVSQKQWQRVQSYIHLGIDEGAALLTGGEGRPDGLEHGWFVRPTLFTHVTNQMRIAREEIFGPVLCVIPYRDEAEAIARNGWPASCKPDASLSTPRRMNRSPHSAASSNRASGANSAHSAWMRS